MPTVKVELSKGHEKSTLVKIRDLVMDSVVESLHLLADDRNIRVIEHEPHLFQMKAPYCILIEISMFVGRTKETKKTLYQSIANNLETCGLFKKEQVLVIIYELPLENWGIRGGIPADEIDLGFKVNV